MRLLLSTLAIAVMAAGFTQTPPSTAAGVIAGVVVDGTGTVVARAPVELLQNARVVQSTTSDARGAFRFSNVAAGIYRVRAVVPGFGSGLATVAVSDQPAVLLRLVLDPIAPREDLRVTSESGSLPPKAALPEPTAWAGQAAVRAGDATHAERPYTFLPQRDFNTEAYAHVVENGFHRASDDPLSTFSIDVDTASYANVRRFLDDGALPPAGAVRVEELINYFRFDYPNPTAGRPFSVTTELGSCPWAPGHRLVLIGLKAAPLEADRTPPRNLVFLLDVSGSMNTPDKLPLVKSAMRMLAATLTPADRVAIVTYAGTSGVALPTTTGANRTRIDRAIADLRPGGSTNGASGIRLAYELAAASFIDGGINRVILATDGDFNVGTTSQAELVRLIEEKRRGGVFLSVLGVGTGNLKDSTMELIANRGNGNYSYLDSLHEARRVLVAEAGATLVTVAKDVKIQVEFNPARVGAYRLVGYENRVLANRDFNDDTKDAGEIGAGHTVTALYEIVPPGSALDVPTVDPLKYQPVARTQSAAASDELLTVKLRYKQPDGDDSRLIDVAVRDRAAAMTPNLGFAAAVAEFGMLLNDSAHVGQSTWTTARELARRFRGSDPDGYRAEFIRLVDLAAALDAQRRPDRDDDGPVTGR